MEDKVVIIGGGVIGAAVAYYLTENGHKNVVIIEREEVACSASGKAGGFLAKDWGNSQTQPLHSLSFDLLSSLSQSLSLSTYRKIATLSVSVSSSSSSSSSSAKNKKKNAATASWLNGEHVSSKMMDETTAQITPHQLTHSLVHAALQRGAKLLISTVCGLLTDDSGNQRVIKGVQLSSGEVVSCEKCVIAMGAWSVNAGDWIGLPRAFPIRGIRSTSLIFHHINKLSNDEPFVLFCDENEHHCHLEVYPRPNYDGEEGEVYLCGCGGSDEITGDHLKTGGDYEKASDVKPNMSRVKAAWMSFEELTEEAKDKQPTRSQACLRPCAPDALPLIGKVASVRNLYMASGHNCWGILWSAATGLLISELILNRPSSIDISPFDPNRFIRPRTAADW